MENKIALDLTFKSFIFHYNVVLIKRILSIILETFDANLNKIVPLQYFEELYNAIWYLKI